MTDNIQTTLTREKAKEILTAESWQPGSHSEAELCLARITLASATPTRDEAVLNLIDEARRVAGAEHIAGTPKPYSVRLLERLADALASAPAPASGGVDAVAHLLRKLEEACNAAASKRSQATYDQMISDPGAEDTLDDLDAARREARAFLNSDLWRRADGQR